MNGSDLLDVRVMQVTWCSPSVLAFSLASVTGDTLPGFEAGAHVSVHLPVAGKPDRIRAYSLINLDAVCDTSLPQQRYQIAVRRDDQGAGGSRQLHELVRPGDLLRISPPKNQFSLDDTQHPLLLAGGIGVTPIASMAAALQQQGKSYELAYAVRSRDEAVFADALGALCGTRLRLHSDEDAGTYLDIRSLLEQVGQRAVYVCGPKAMIDATVEAAASLGWPAGAVRFELFGADPSAQSQSGYEVILKQSDKTLFVHAGEALLDVLIDEDVDLPYDCRSGFCGLCQVKVLEGEVAHHDTCLSPADRSQRGLMQACVSHACGSRLVLDL